MSDTKFEKCQLTVDFSVLFDRMSEDDQKMFIKSFAVQSNIIEHVMDYVCGDDPDGWWSGYDDDYRLRALRRIEQAQLKRWSRYNWKFIEEATSRLKEIKEKKHIYWALHHGPFKDELWPVWSKFCEANGIVSEYTTKQADDDIANVLAIIKDALDKMAGADE